ncbi:MAG TPA: MOSC and FAD-binding oxidoreductase domain-containing protein [Caulobacteraceae bacterium]|jgi:ferredoxin-NADP reductase/MOSC domain-containing protein YiiM
MARLLSVNVGLPRDIVWRGRTVHTGIWKAPVSGRRRVGRLNVEGDGQGDLAGHGGEQRAVFVYQIESYRYWQERLGRRDFVYGQFGENFTVEGLADDEVCIGDRYRIGAVLLEVTQPRVTCYRVGVRMDHPQMPALLTSSGRPGFYFRVIEEGEVAAGDAIDFVARGPQRMTVTDVNALLYSSSHPRDQLERALQIPALSQGWRGSFENMLKSLADHPDATGNPGLAPAAASQTAKPGFRPLRVARIEAECSDVLSLTLQATDGEPLTAQRPGQFVVLRLHPTADGTPLLRSYSLSGSPSEAQYRISVKLEPNGAAGTYLHTHVHAGDVVEVSEPRGAFTLVAGEGPVVLLSAGIGATPVMAMLHALAEGATARDVWWLHVARDGARHVFAAEARGLLARLARAHSHVWYSRPAGEDRAGADYDTGGRLDAGVLSDLGVSRDGDFYICGPSGFMDDLIAALRAWGVTPDRIHSEAFAGGPALTPGIAAITSRAPHQPDGPAGAGPLVSFARSGLAVRWRLDSESLLELAEACDVPVRWSCRSGVCHNCESGLISGAVAYEPDPLDPPATGNVLLCCARPQGDVVIDI